MRETANTVFKLSTEAQRRKEHLRILDLCSQARRGNLKVSYGGLAVPGDVEGNVSIHSADGLASDTLILRLATVAVDANPEKTAFKVSIMLFNTLNISILQGQSFCFQR